MRHDSVGPLLTQRIDESITPERFAWDAAGNLLDEIERKSRGRVEGDRLRVWQDIRFEYDARRNVSTKRHQACIRRTAPALARGPRRPHVAH